MTAHKHAALMAQYAQDAMETETPWEGWQFRPVGTEKWLEGIGGFSYLCEIRRKPSTLTYTVTIPEPMRKAPEVGKTYYVATQAAKDLYMVELAWEGHEIDTRLLKRGLCFATKEDAIAAAKAMLPIKGEEA